jgi:uncharacterized metal-binding protein
MENNKDFLHLYTDEDKKTLKTAEDALNPRIDRIDEIIEYAREAGLQHIGIAHCTAFNREAEILKQTLTAKGFVVDNVNCKYGKIPFNDLVPGYKGVSCNPAGQAQYLEEKNTELNIMMGLCLGHDMIFNSKSKAPVTPLVVKDRKLKHHTLSALKQN